MNSGHRIWLITGISRGFGKALAVAALERGDTVIGTTRDGRTDLERSARLNVLPLEMTDAAAVGRVVNAAQGLHGRLDVVVNNAGYGLLGSVEEGTEEEVSHLFDVNFHGPRRVIQAALPHLRRQGSGHIINITSIAGIAPSAGAGYYAAAKSAVEALTQSLAKEVGPLGIRVTLIEPGAFRTDFLSTHSIRSSAAGLEEYAATVGATRERLGVMAGQQQGDPALAAKAIIGVVDSSAPPLHLILGPDAYGRAREVLDTFSAELERWKAVTLGTDFRA